MKIRAAILTLYCSWVLVGLASAVPTGCVICQYTGPDQWTGVVAAYVWMCIFRFGLVMSKIDDAFWLHHQATRYVVF